MQLTRAADYAVRVMIHLASQPEAAVVHKTILATAAEAPESFVSKILQALARAGLIQARRGVEGGFSLLPAGVRASLLDVVEAIDGPIALNICLTSGTSCHRQSVCPAHDVWVRAQSAMLSVLSEAKIADMGMTRASGRGLQKIALASESGSLALDQHPLPGVLPGKSTNKGRTHSASAVASGATGKKQNI